MILDIKNLRVKFRGAAGDGSVYAVNGVNLALDAGEVHAIVGESGSGKSVTARAVLGLLSNKNDSHAAVDGEVIYKGQNLLTLKEEELRKTRGKEIAMIFQNPASHLSPLMKVEHQIKGALRNHLRLSSSEADFRVRELLSAVGLAKDTAKMYPFELSGGMQQRVMIAIAVALKPSILIADEATTALDVTIQKQILDLLCALCKDLNMALLFITHNFALVEKIADRVSVMYAGQIVETAPAPALFLRPSHPYTRALIDCIPKSRARPLPSIAGFPPKLREAPYLCPFAPRCRSSIPPCRTDAPPEKEVTTGHSVRCLAQ